MKKLLITLALLSPVKSIAAPTVIIAELSGDVNDSGRQRMIRTLTDRMQAKITLAPYKLESVEDVPRALSWLTNNEASIVLFGTVERYFGAMARYEDVGAIKLHYVTREGYQGRYYYILPQPGVTMPPDFENDLRKALKP